MAGDFKLWLESEGIKLLQPSTPEEEKPSNSLSEGNEGEVKELKEQNKRLMNLLEQQVTYSARVDACRWTKNDNAIHSHCKEVWNNYITNNALATQKKVSEENKQD